MGRGNANVLECRESRSDVFFTRGGGGGGVTSRKIGEGFAALFLKPLLYFRPDKKFDHGPISDLTFKSIPYHKPAL